MIHNKYAKPSGEEHASEGLANLLQKNGHTVEWYTRSSSEIDNNIFGKVKAFLTEEKLDERVLRSEKRIYEIVKRRLGPIDHGREKSVRSSN